MKQIPEFIPTKEYKRFLEFCNACRKENYIGLCYGPAGVGKSMAAYHLANWYTVLHEIELKNHLTEYLRPSVQMDDFDTIVYTPSVSCSPAALNQAIQNLIYTFTILIERSLFGDESVPGHERVKPRVKLLIVDEADRLQAKTLECLRDLYDQRNIPIILIGMPGIEKRLIRFPQFYSRIGFAHAYKLLTDQEVSFVIQNHLRLLGLSVEDKDFTDQEAVAAVTRITQGNFRMINRLLKQAIRLMQVNQLSSITKEVIDAARECLVIGNVY